MRCLVSTNTDPAFNLAAEEYLFRNGNDLLLFLYSNAPSVVVGKHQNALAEIDYWFVKENNIGVYRRISGGGAVYHDPGNLNFSFHASVDDPSKVSYRKFVEPVAAVLNSIGIPAEVGTRNDITVDGLKVSGHAAHVFRRRVLSHGTLLVNANKEFLSKSLKNNENKISGKAIASVRSKVANLADYNTSLDVDSLRLNLINFFADRSSVQQVENFSSFEEEQIEQLANEKYRTWNWNFGYSPDYQLSGMVSDHCGTIRFLIKVAKGIIVGADLHANCLSANEITTLQQQLINRPHREEELVKVFSNQALSFVIQKIDLNKLIEALF